MKFKNLLNEQVQPKTKEELKKIIEKNIKKNGNNCDLNFIDVSLIKDMSFLFQGSKFNGDISKWDVSKVTNMSYMFLDSKFNGDISKWNVSNVEYMEFMFRHSKFNGDISKWGVSKKVKGEDMWGAFDNCPLHKNPPKWYKIISI